METPKKMVRKCSIQKTTVALILMKMKSNMEQEEESQTKQH